MWCGRRKCWRCSITYPVLMASDILLYQDIALECQYMKWGTFKSLLMDALGTQIQATMFNEAARKFYEKFQLGKVYYISSGTLNVAN
ncbi:hypothetical protein V6N11_011557 [Hibiscus sabdariffa]|uniref:Replication factor A C-terminal domain-containing protein n=1 Tax=Hibiscus sabdariffa TaxID=183260 RepID=A0ABR2S9F0_9ROSI